MAGVVWAPATVAATQDSIPYDGSKQLPDFTFEEVEASKAGEADSDVWDNLLASQTATIFLQQYRNAIPGYHTSRHSRYSTSSLVIRAPPLR